MAVFAPNSNLRALVTASLRGKNSPKLPSKEMNESVKPYQAKSMSWAQRPVTGPAVTGPAVTGQSKRVFNIDINECERCEKHNLRIVAYITAPMVIQKLLPKYSSHLDKQASLSLIPQPHHLIPQQHGPPMAGPAQNIKRTRMINSLFSILKGHAW